MVLRMNKKGFFFTIMSLILVSSVLLILVPQSHEAVITMEKAEETGLKYGNDFYEALEHSILPSFIRTAAYNALDNISRNYTLLIASGVDFDTAFKGLFWNESRTISDLGNKYNMSHMLGVLEDAFDEASPDLYELDIEEDYEHVVITIFQNNDTGPYQVGVNVSMRATLTTPFALWNRTLDITSFVPIIGLEDPIYFNFTNEQYRNFFEYSPLDIGKDLNATQENLEQLYTPVQIGCFLSKSWNYTCFKDHVNRSAYFKNTLAPSFLQRMRLNISANSTCCGIESFLNPNTSFPKGIDMEKIKYGYEGDDGDNKNMTYVDHCFFSGNCTGLEGDNPDRMDNITALECLNDTFPYFKIDLIRLDYYNLSDCVQWP